MDIKVKLNNLRTAPRKVRLVVDLVRNKNVSDARALLMYATKKPSDLVLKLLNSAAASAVNNFKLKESNLYISKITVDEGPKLKRWHPMSRGRAYQIMKRTSHITLVLSDTNGKSNRSAGFKQNKQKRAKMQNYNKKLKIKKRAKRAA